jgi:hypothetical protein
MYFYQYNQRVHRPRNFLILLLTVIVTGVIILGIWFFVRKDSKQTQTPKNTLPIIHNVTSGSGNHFHVAEKWFSMDLPDDWKLMQKSESPAHIWTWQATKKNADDRTIDLYIDFLPADVALNKLQPVKANGTKLDLGTLSDDCTNFTNAGDHPSEDKLALWQGVSFTCRVTSPISGIIGTGSTEGPNKVTLTGPTSGPHSYFFIFTDHDIHPNPTIFTDALTSFRVN